MRFLRALPLVLTLAAGLAAPATAATFTIAFTQDGLGDTGPDWFGTFDTAPGTPLLDGVTRFDVTIGGVRFDDLALGVGFFNGTTTGGIQALTGLVVDTIAFVPDLGIPDFRGSNVLFLAGLDDTGNAVRNWGFGVNCSPETCTGPVLGTYTVTQVRDPEPPPVIPLPASAALLPIGLGALAMIRRRRARAA